jgi:hypothetical protein
MGFIDRSEVEYLPVYYNVNQSVGVYYTSAVNNDTPASWTDDHVIIPDMPSPGLTPGKSPYYPNGYPTFPDYMTPETPPVSKSQPRIFPCPNLRDDVLLVQYLLKAFYDTLPANQRPKGKMKVDGICGPITNNWILRFQLDANKYNGEPLVIVDNHVDKVLNKNLVGSIGGKMYTLAVLNMNVKYYNYDAWARTPLFVPLQNPYGVSVDNSTGGISASVGAF